MGRGVAVTRRSSGRGLGEERSTGRRRGKSVRDERSFCASTRRKALGVAPDRPVSAAAHSRRRGPSTGCARKARASSSEAIASAGDRAAAQARDLREDEPHPVARLAAGAELRERLVVGAAGVLGGHEALEVGHAVSLRPGRRTSPRTLWCSRATRRVSSGASSSHQTGPSLAERRPSRRRPGPGRPRGPRHRRRLAARSSSRAAPPSARATSAARSCSRSEGSARRQSRPRTTR